MIMTLDCGNNMTMSALQSWWQASIFNVNKAGHLLAGVENMAFRRARPAFKAIARMYLSRICACRSNLTYALTRQAGRLMA